MYFCRVSPDAVHILRFRRHLGLADHLPRLPMGAFSLISRWQWEAPHWLVFHFHRFYPFLFCFVFCLFVCLFFCYIRMLRLSLSKILRTYEEHTQTERYFAFFFFFCVNSNWKYNKNVELWSNSTINPNTTNTKIYIFLTLKMRFLIARYTEEQFSLLFPGHFWMDLLKYYTTLLKEHTKNVYRLKSQRKTVQPQSQNHCHLVLKSITENLRYETLNFRKHLPGYS